MARRHMMRSPTKGAARRALHRRLREEDPTYQPPPTPSPKEAWRERLLMFALFAVVAALIFGVVLLDG